MALLGLLLLAFTFFCSSDANGLFINEQCRPHPALVSIDRPNYQFYPYIVKLHRCGGACGHAPPTIQKCVVLEAKNVTMTVFDVGSNRMTQMKLLNHTRCGCECVTKPSDCTKVQVYNKDSCECRCKYHHTPPEPCPAGFRWSGTECACVCHKPPEVCPVGKTWDSSKCGCTCKSDMVARCSILGLKVNDECQCTDVEVGANRGDKPQDNPKFTKFTFFLMAGEFILLCIIFDAILCRWKAGFTYSVVQKLKCKGRQKDVKSPETNIGKDNATEFSSVSTKDCAEQV